MANLSVLPQVSANISPATAKTKNQATNGQAQALDPKVLQAQFEQKLSDALNGEETAQSPDDEQMGSQALAMGAGVQPVIAADVKNYRPVMTAVEKTPADQTAAAQAGVAQALAQQGFASQAPLGRATTESGSENAANFTQNFSKNLTPQEKAQLLATPAVAKKAEARTIPSEFQVNPLKAKSNGIDGASKSTIEDDQAAKLALSKLIADYQLGKTASVSQNIQSHSQNSAAGIPAAGVSIESLMGLQNGQSDGLELENVSENKNNVSKLGKKIGTHSSNLSTDSFLNLRDLSQNKVNPLSSQSSIEQLQQQALTQQNSPVSGKGQLIQSVGKKVNPKEMHLEQLGAGSMMDAGLNHAAPSLAKMIEAPVTQGSGNRPVLTHDTLNQISSQVSQFNQNKQDGEIKIRLRPDHLGELQMSVRTQGQNVTIQIKARDEQSKKIIEDSLSSLKDNLQLQNLSLGKVEVVTLPQQEQKLSMNMDFNAQGNPSQFNQSNNEEGYSGKRFQDEQPTQINVPNVARAKEAARVAQQNTGRLDMIA